MKRFFYLLPVLVIFLATTSCKKNKVYTYECLEGELNPEVLDIYQYNWCGSIVDRIEWYVDGKHINPDNNGKGWVSIDIYEARDYLVELKLFKEREFSISGKENEDSYEFIISVPKRVRIEAQNCVDSTKINSASYTAKIFKSMNDFQDYIRYGNDKFTTFYESNNGDFYRLLGEVPFGNNLVYIESNELLNDEISNFSLILDQYITTGDFSNVNIVDIIDQKYSVDVMPSPNFVKRLIAKKFYKTAPYSTQPDPCWEDTELTFNMDGTWQLSAGPDVCFQSPESGSGTFYFDDLTCDYFETNYIPLITIDNTSGNSPYPNGTVVSIKGGFNFDLEITFTNNSGQYETHRFRTKDY